MNIFQHLSEKSWLDNPAAADASTQVAYDHAVAQRIALRFFIAIVSVLFFLFFITYISHSQYPDFEALAGEPWKPFANKSSLWFNTVLLAASSIAMHIGLKSAQAQKLNATFLAMLAAAFFALLFILAQFWLWRQLTAMGYHLTGNAANSYFYLLTATHGLHLLGGVVVLMRSIMIFWQRVDLERTRNRIALCTTYWHYLLILWLILFALLSSSPETYKTIAAICGL